MRIRANRLSHSLCALAPVLLLACNAADETSPSPEPSGAPAGEDCLTRVWASQDRPEQAFDRANDAVEGGTISCATGSSPAQFRDAVAALQQAAAASDRTRMLGEISFPLLYIDAIGTARTLDAAAIEEGFDEIFDPATRALIARAELAEMTVVPDQGAFFELGALWLVVPAPGARPRLATVNHQALAEAAAANAGG